MSEVADFLRARYAEQWELAEAAADDSEKDWSPGDENFGSSVNEASSGAPVVIGPWDYLDWDVRRHIAAHDPANVIADLDAKLALIDELEPPEKPREPETDAQLHARCAHPAWEYRTTEGPRKQWDDIEEPPHDGNGDPEPGWERNLDAGRDGWDRFDYTEESYWRRRRADGPRAAYVPRGLRILAQPFAGHADHKGEEWAP